MTQGSGLTGRKRACLSCQSKFTEDITACPKDGTPLVVVQDDLCGTVLGSKYELLEVIGTGGMGLVYRARHNMMNRMVAIKVLNKAHISDTASLKRFQIEAQAASALSMPHILAVFDFGVAVDGQPYMVMDLLNGPSLDKVLDAEGRLPVERAVRICIQVCDALAHAHSKGIIHRDIKPSNIILVQNEDQPDFVKLVDFGIAKLINPTDPELAGLTRTGEVFGSPLYMSPEQWHAKTLDPRTDMYSLGAVMYRTLCGRFMFDKCDIVQLMYKHVSQMPPPFAKFGVDVPHSIEEIVFKALAKQPDDRFQSMSEMAQALRRAYADLGQEPGSRELPASSETATRLVLPVSSMSRQRTDTVESPTPNTSDSIGSGAVTGPLTVPSSDNVGGRNNEFAGTTGSAQQSSGSPAVNGNTGSQPAPASSAPAPFVTPSVTFSQSLQPGALASTPANPLRPAVAKQGPSVSAESKQPVDRKRKIIVALLCLWVVVLAVAMFLIYGHKTTSENAEVPATIPAPVTPPVHTPPPLPPAAKTVVSPTPPNTMAPPEDSAVQQTEPPVHSTPVLNVPDSPPVSSHPSAAEPTAEPPIKESHAESHATKSPRSKRIGKGFKTAFNHGKNWLKNTLRKLD